MWVWDSIFEINAYSEKPNLSTEAQFLDGSSWTQLVQNPVHSESSVMYLHHGNMIIHILHFIPTATLWVERFTYGVCWEGLIFNLESLKMDNLNCCSGGRFLLILWRVLLQMGWLTFIDVLSSSFLFPIILVYLQGYKCILWFCFIP